MKTKTIKQKAIIPASPLEVYNALTDSKKHTAFTRAKAKVSTKEGGAYTAYDGYITGKNIKLVPGKKIVQTWRAVDGVWPEEHESEVTFDLKKHPKGTEISFTHKNVPASQVAEFTKGWKDFYWAPLKEYFGK